VKWLHAYPPHPGWPTPSAVSGGREVAGELQVAAR
jgi:hypothetical protein